MCMLFCEMEIVCIRMKSLMTDDEFTLNGIDEEPEPNDPDFSLHAFCRVSDGNNQCYFRMRMIHWRGCDGELSGTV